MTLWPDHVRGLLAITKAQRQRFLCALEAWDGTPYMAGCACPQRGVDCVRLVDCLLQSTFGLNLKPLPRECQDAAFHDVKVVAKTSKLIKERFQAKSVPLDENIGVYPADVLVVKHKEGKNPHHVLIVGPDGIKTYHAQSGVGVSWTGLGGVNSMFHITHIYRSRFAGMEDS